MSESTPPNRRLFDVPLQPIAGSRFQPTGFPDIGAALFKRPERRGAETVWTDSLLLESAQSMANRLEEAGWDKGSQAQAGAFDGLPYIRVLDAEGEHYLTSSRTEAHRLASAFVKDSSLDGTSMIDELKGRLRLEDDRPLAPRDIAAAVFSMDPLCLVHGVFFADSKWPGQPKIARALTAFIEAHDVQRADSGGVKRDDVRHSIARATVRFRFTEPSTPRPRSSATSASTWLRSGRMAWVAPRPNCSRRSHCGRSDHCSTGPCACELRAIWSRLLRRSSIAAGTRWRVSPISMPSSAS